jgi:hypothetical protein
MNKFWLAGVRVGSFVWATVRAALPYGKIALLTVIGILLVPPIERYWGPRMTEFPSIPISALALMFLGAMFMTAAAAFIYVCGLLIVQIVQMERAPRYPGRAPGLTPVSERAKVEASTGGSFIPNDDETLFLREQFDILKKQGVLTDTDKMDLETMAKEIGLQTILKERGRTE